MRQRRSARISVRRLSGVFRTRRGGSREHSSSGTSRRRLPSSGKLHDLAEAEGHHPDISFGWGYVTVSLQTKKIKGLHENDFIMAAKLDHIATRPAA